MGGVKRDGVQVVLATHPSTHHCTFWVIGHIVSPVPPRALVHQRSGGEAAAVGPRTLVVKTFDSSKFELEGIVSDDDSLAVRDGVPRGAALRPDVCVGVDVGVCQCLRSIQLPVIMSSITIISPIRVLLPISSYSQKWIISCT